VDPAVQIHGSIGFGVQVPRARSKLTPFPHTVLGGTPGHGSELEAAVEHLCLPTDGSMDLDCWIHGSMDLHW